eukprot:gb/GEZN01007830.1/.p1 GENE.gb/GEZN01007830.1/~~gb/GEZN01007830.1/.p1  ORF type:complete len:353 (+),score=38.28 gb/GEZN01007830.1/:134-1192(+)
MWLALLSTLSCVHVMGKAKDGKDGSDLFYPGALGVIPEDGRGIYLEAFSQARNEIRIEICVLEDPEILQGLNDALSRGVTLRIIVDNGKYQSIASERENLAMYVTSAGGVLHLSNPIFPRSFPKVILIDGKYVLVGSACLDSTTFANYRDYVYVSDNKGIISDLSDLFENDWLYTRPPSDTPPPYNPTPPVSQTNLFVSPVNAADRFVAFIQQARKTLDVTSEELGNPTLQSELIAAVERGVKVRFLGPLFVNGATTETQALQNASLATLYQGGIQIRVSLPPESATNPYIHARSAISDRQKIYLGSISLSPDSITFNREVGLILSKETDKYAVERMQEVFNMDFARKAKQS